MIFYFLGIIVVQNNGNLPKSWVFGYFLEFESLDFSDFAHYDRQACYLAGTGGHVAEKNIWPKFGPFRPS